MKRLFATTLLLVGLLWNATADAAPPFSVEKEEVKTLMKRMYSYPSRTFESGEFNGKYDAKRFCILQRDFFDDTLLRFTTGGECDTAGVVPGYPRYPVFDEEAVAYDRHREPGLTSQIESISVNDDGAVAKVAFHESSSRVVFFLKKANKGWRITNLLSYKRWPLDLGPEGCHSPGYQFALPPTSLDQLEDLPSACRKSEEWNLKQRAKK